MDKFDTEIPNESSIRITSDQYNEATYSLNLIHEIVNSGANWEIITNAIEEGRARDISDEPKAPLINGEKTPCIILGSGPSLNYSIKFLKNWKGGIFATTSHALSLVRYGIYPTHIVVLDPFCTWDEIAGVDWSKSNTKLVCHPGCYPNLIKNWPNDILLYLQNNGKNSSFYHDVQKKMYVKRIVKEEGIRKPIFQYYIRTEISIFACSPPLQLFVADQLGYGTAFLCGCDFGFPGNKERFDEWTPNKEECKNHFGTNPISIPKVWGINDNRWVRLWKQNIHPDYTSNINTIISKNKIPSERVHIYYKKNFISAWRMSNKTIYTTDHGTITEIPYTPIYKVISRQGLRYPVQSEKMIRKITDDYLSKVECFVIEGENGGKIFLESQKPIEDAIKLIDSINRQWECPICKNTMTATDDNDYSEYNCLKCGRKGLKKSAGINKEENLKRFEFLIRMNKEEKVK